MTEQNPKLTAIARRPAAQATQPRETASVHIELDERAFVFPQHKPISHLVASPGENGRVEISVVYEFNNTKHDSWIASLSYDDCQQFCRKLVDAYYQGRTQNVLSDTAKIGIVFNPNGFLVMFQQPENEIDLFIAPSSLVRVTKGLLKVLDRVLPIVSH